MSDAILEAVQATIKHFDYLAGRWSDESEYEEFDDYKANFMKVFPAFTIVEAKKRPFTFTITHKDDANRRFILKATARQITLHELTRT